MTNPLIEQGDLLRFDAITPACVTEAIKAHLKDATLALEAVTRDETPATWDAVVDPLKSATEKLHRTWGALGHLMGVADCEGWRNAYAENVEAVTTFSVQASQNTKLYAKYKAMRDNGEYERLDSVRRRVIDRTIRDFKLSGAELPSEKKARLEEIAQEEALLSQQFSQNLQDATDAFALDIEKREELAGVPESALKLYETQAKAAGKEGFRIGLTYPNYLPILRYAENRALRSKLHKAYSIRASDLGPEKQNNGPLIRKLLALRAEEASLLGFKNAAEESLATKMADSPEAVTTFLRDMAKRARPYAERDVRELEKYAKEELQLDTVFPWDRNFVSEKLRQDRYCFNAEEVREYFPLPKVLSGLFSLAERLFGIKIEPSSAPTWHPDVRFFAVKDADGTLIARFYADFYARAGKRSGAWMDSARDRDRLPNGTLITPVAYLVCNFTQPVGEEPSYLTHDEVETLFHEFGHSLQHMLTRVEVSDLSGINGVEWDAVEMPSQFMENWTWNFETLEALSEKRGTGEKLPRALFEKMLAAKNFQSGMFALRQIEFALFDMRIHMERDADYVKVLTEVREEIAVTKASDYDRFAESFSHIFAGGYSAGYYSYKWAEVLSADAFAAFEEAGLFDKATAKRWLEEILATGGSRDAIDSFKAFRGRAPTIDALMRHTGLTDPL